VDKIIFSTFLLDTKQPLSIENHKETGKPMFKKRKMGQRQSTEAMSIV
jgi:hypothetical protein